MLVRTAGLASTQIVPVVTEAVLRTERDVLYKAGDFLAPGVGVSKQEYRIPISPTGGMVLRRTKRGPLGQIEWSEASPGRVDGKLQRMSYAYGFDTDQAANDDAPWETRALCAMRAQLAVTLDRAYTFHRPLLLSDANFGAVTNAPDWVTNGNSRETINTAAAAIRDVVGVPKAKLSVALFGAAADHALDDPLFIERRKYTVPGDKAPGMPDLAAYWGVAEVEEFYEVYKATEDAAATNLYADHAVVFYKPPGDPRMGSHRWASTYYHDDYGNEGQALDDIEVPQATGLLTPWQGYWQVVVHNVGAAHLIKSP